MKKLITCLLCFYLLSCDKSSLLLPDEIKPYTPTIVWKSTMFAEKGSYEEHPINIYKDQLTVGFNRGFYVFDKLRGDSILKYDKDYILKSQDNFIINNEVHTRVKSNFYRIYNFDDKRVRYIDKIPPDYKNVTQTIYSENKLYSGSIGFTPPSVSSIWQAELSERSLPWKPIYEHVWPKDVILPIFAKPFCLHIHKNQLGDEVLYFGNLQYYKDSINKNRIIYQAYNLTKKQDVWKSEIFYNVENPVTEPASTDFAPIIFDGKILFYSEYHMATFDMITGRKIWELTSKHAFSPGLIAEGMHAFVVDGFSNVSKIDLLSGKLVKQIKSVVSIPSKIVALDGTLYLVRSNALLAIDMKKMKPKWEWKNPASGSCYNCSFELSSPIIDETTKSLFITDGRELYCIKLPE